jgi:hypothetical protein
MRWRCRGSDCGHSMSTVRPDARIQLSSRALLRFSQRAWPRLTLAVHAELVHAGLSSILENDREYQRRPLLVFCISRTEGPYLAVESRGTLQFTDQLAADLFAEALDAKCVPRSGLAAPQPRLAASLGASHQAMSWELTARIVSMAGSFVRTLFIAMAADRWGVAPSLCMTSSSIVVHPPTGRRVIYSDLASAVARHAPAAVQLRTRGPTKCPAWLDVARPTMSPAQRGSRTRFRPYLFRVDTESAWRLVDTVVARGSTTNVCLRSAVDDDRAHN